jgi:hypothetical protein
MTSLAPLWLGPALSPIMAAATEAQHVCACGMTPGTCGCPECERVERERLSEKSAPPFPTLKGECDTGSPVLSAVAIPPSILPASLSLTPPTFVALAPATPRVPLASLASPRPPTPPPRVRLEAAA